MMSMSKRVKLNARGDTIIEVLLALTIISSMLAGAYVTLGQSTNNARQSQERSEALKLVESQVERLRLISDSIAADRTEIFCLDSAGVVKSAYNPARNRPMVALESDTFASYATDCKVQAVSGGITYYLSIEPETGKLYRFRARWDKAGGAGGGKEEAKISYRTPEVVTVVAPPASPGALPPTASLSAPANGATVSGGSVALTATASTPQGSITNVQFLVNNVVVGSDATSPYSITWDSRTLGNGSYPVRAVSTNNDGLTASSSTATVISCQPKIYAFAGLPFSKTTVTCSCKS